MRLGLRRWVLMAFIMGLCSACNLQRATPTPIPQTPQPPTATRIQQTRIPSVTPLQLPGLVQPTEGGIIIPDCPQPDSWIAYTVQTGDSLGALAANTGSTAAALAEANCLDDPNTLFAGQVIYLPRLPLVTG